MRWHTSIVGQLGKTTQFRQQITQFRTFFSHDLTKNHYPSSKSVSFMPNSLSRTLTSPQAATSQKTCRSFLYATNPEKIQKKAIPNRWTKSVWCFFAIIKARSSSSLYCNQGTFVHCFLHNDLQIMCRNWTHYQLLDENKQWILRKVKLTRISSSF